MSNFSKMLDELIQENNLERKIFANNIGISASRITDYINNEKFPTVENLIKIADYFHCSTDFLLGREEQYNNLTFKECPPFSKQIVFLKNEFGGTVDKFIKKAEVARTSYFYWVNDKYQPSVDNIICLAKNLDRRVDYVLGRES